MAVSKTVGRILLQQLEDDLLSVVGNLGSMLAGARRLRLALHLEQLVAIAGSER